jgi:phosphatidyl-myo-inositol dimannoside synthase
MTRLISSIDRPAPASPGVRRVLLLVTDAFDTQGGIQTFSRALIRAISEWCEETGGEAEVLVINDRLGRRAAGDYVASERVRCTGFSGSKLRFAAAAARGARRADLVVFGHAYFLRFAPLLRLANRRAAFRLIVYGIEVWRRISWLRRSQLRRLDRIVSISRATWSRMAEANGLREHPVVINPAPIDPRHEEQPGNAALPAGLPANARILLTVSRLDRTEARKGIDHVIGVLPDLIARVPDLYYVVVGDGEDRARLQALAEAEGVAGRVVFTGRLPDEELRSIYGACELFVLMSTKEGFGIVLLEAMFSAKPCIGADAGGIPEVIVEGETGFLVRPDDRGATADRILRLLSDVELRERMGRAGRTRYDERFSFDRFRSRVVRDLLTRG